MPENNAEFQIILKNIEKAEKNQLDDILVEIETYSFQANQLGQLYLKIVDVNPDIIKNIPQDSLTKDICISAIKGRWMNISHVPEKFIDSDSVFEKALEAADKYIEAFGGEALNCLPPYKQTREQCQKALEKNIKAMPFVPEAFLDGSELKTKLDKYRKYLLENYKNLELFDKIKLSQLSNKIINNQLSQAIIEKDIDLLPALPAKSRTLFICEIVANKIIGFNSEVGLNDFLNFMSDYKNNTALSDSEYKDFLLDTIVKSKNKNIIQYFKKEHYDFDMIKELADHFPSETNKITETVEENFLTQKQWKEIYTIALEKQGDLIESVPADLIDLSLCEIAIEQNPKTIQYLKEYQNKNLSKAEYQKLFFQAVEKEIFILHHANSDIIDFKLYKLAAEKSGANILSFDHNNKNITPEEYQQLYATALKTYPGGLKNIPKKSRNIDLLRIAIMHGGSAIRYIDEDEIKAIGKEEYSKLCNEAIKQDPMAIEHIHSQYLTQDMCAKAANISCLSLIYVPKKWLDSDLFKELLEKIYQTVETQGFMLQFIPISKRSIDICLKAVNQSIGTIEHVPEKLLYDDAFKEKIIQYRKHLFDNYDGKKDLNYTPKANHIFLARVSFGGILPTFTCFFLRHIE